MKGDVWPDAAGGVARARQNLSQVFDGGGARSGLGLGGGGEGGRQEGGGEGEGEGEG